MIANLQMFVKIIFEVVGFVRSSLFNNLVIPAIMIDFFIIECDAIQGFKEPTVLTAKFVRKQSLAQCFTFTISASLYILIITGERSVGRVCGIILISVTKTLLDELKSF